MRATLERVLVEGGYQLTDTPGVGVARVRIAITEVQESKWYLNLHPASKASGAGVGGASMEGEVVDSVTGEQLAATVKVGRGNQFKIDSFDSLEDAKHVIDKWSVKAVKRLELRRKERAGG